MSTKTPEYNIIIKAVKRRRAEIIAFLLILEKWRKQKRLSKRDRQKSQLRLCRHNQQSNIATRLSNNSSQLLTTDVQEGIISSSPVISISSNLDSPQNNSTVITPGPTSPALSTSTCAISSVSQNRFKEKNRHDSTEDDFCGAINNLAQLSRQPIIISNINDTWCSSENSVINGFLSFTGTILKSFQDEKLKLEVMSIITQAVINAKSLDLKNNRT